MKKRLFYYIFPILFLAGLLSVGEKAKAQTASFAYLSGGVSDNATVTSSSAVVYGFSVTVAGSGSITFSKYYIGVNNGNATANFANATLVRCTNTTYSAGASTPVGSVTMSSGTGATAITIDNLSETISAGSSRNYFLVVDVIGTNSSYCQLYSNNSQIATDNSGTNYNSGSSFNKYTGNNFSNSNNGTNVPLRITPEASGLTGNTSSLLAGTSDVAVLGFSLTGSGNYKVSQIYINSNTSTLSQYFSGFTLYTTGTTSSYSTGGRTAVTATVSMSGSYVSIAINGTNLQATTTQKYYWLVANVKSPITGTIPANLQFNISSGQSNTAFTSAGGNCNTATVFGPSYNINYANLTVAAVSNGLSSTTVYPGEVDKAVFGFSLTATSGTSTITGIAINSDNSSLSSYYSNFRLYSNTTNDYSTGTKTLLGTVTTPSGSFVNFSTLNVNQTLSSTPTYYFLVADVSYSGTSTNSTTFKFVNGQSSAALTQTSPSSTYNTFNVSGSAYNITQPSITLSGNSTGLLTGYLYYGNTTQGIYGFSIQTTGIASLKGFVLTDLGGISTSAAFANVKLYRGTSNTFNSANIGSYTYLGAGTLSGSTITFSGLNDAVNNTTQYYYMVVDDVYFNSSDHTQLVMTSFTTSTGTTTPGLYGVYYNFSTPAVSVNGANDPNTNGITPGALYFGQTDIVLYGFSVQATGSLNITGFNIAATSYPTNANVPNKYFSNARLYRSTTNVFPGGAPLYTSSNVSVGATYFTATVNETITNTTYYYWLVVDYTVNTGSAATFSAAVTGGQSSYAIVTNPASSGYNSYYITGKTFTIPVTEDWTGAVNNNFSNGNNYTLIDGSAGISPDGNTTVRIGSKSYGSNSPNINTDTSLGGLTFGSGGSTAALTINSGKTLTLANGLNLTSGVSASITGGTVSISNGASSSIASTARLTLGASTTINNLGTFKLLSNASGTGSIDVIPSTSSITGTFIVQRYFTGGTLANRGYRLMSFPVNTSGTLPVTSAATSNFSSLKTNLLITGAGGSASGWDQPSGYTANGPTILFYNTASNNFTIPTTFSSTTATAGKGFYFYFRGDNQNNLTNKVIKSGTYATPESNIVGLQTGTLNQQDFNYTLSNAGQGYNLVGNPYPSSISVTAACLTGTTGFVYTYTPGGSSITSNATPVTIASGQGFFVKSNNATSSIAFSESLKTTGQPATLLLGTPATAQEGNIKLQMVQDSANYDFAQLRFMDTYDKNYIETEDADDFNGSGQVVFFGAMTADNHLVGIASQPLDKKSTSVYLSVNDNTGGTFKINRIDLSNIPDKFDVRLIDHFKKDSIDLRKDSTYTFVIDKNNAATYGNSRLEVVVRVKALPPYQLLTFTGVRSKGDNVLNWTTKNEYTYTYFELQRSFDNQNFEGVNNSYATNNGSYTFTDKTNKPVVYYRLKQTDIYDNVTYSVVVILKADDSNIFSVYPNPTDNTLHFALTQEVKKTVTLRIYNSVGTLMKMATYTTNSGDQDVSKLTPGSYMAELIDDYTKKLIASAKFIKL